MEIQPDESYRLFAAKALHRRLQVLSHEIEGVRRADGIECVYRMRVASHRLRAACRLLEVLGDLHDCDLWIAFLPQSLEGERHRKEPFLTYARSVRRLSCGLSAPWPTASGPAGEGGHA